MARRFRGESTHKVDAKGRVSIPAAFRRVLEEGDPDWTDGLFPNLVLVYGGKSRDFVEGYTMDSMEEVDEKIAQLPRGSKQRRMLEHMFSGQSQQIQIDPTGRLVLTQKIRDKIGISNEAFFIAAGDTFQIWEPSAYDAHATRMDEWFDEDEDDFDPLALLDMASTGE
ncbi:division/cell wall cluster transcriptional repressor MraZ [Amylibacter sp. SFDW26]|uniref:division/cell wall cluster transcriptional repressor MraZ n=1 Tax=Amylibacter sp. SFDW26 TaxID=2652722 RepID=UPI00126279D4|nr:division/cell wall cluster transcriptional repressor MraZ [Amylibacter sp. SFDW26]KAB7610343.1 division/cell wall cluster transcriptional repressor MraZ [Amylibacter sp. SFDW26]